MFQKLKSIINMKQFFFTFGQSHVHNGVRMNNYFIEIIAESYEIARQLMFARYDDKWAFQYNKEEFKTSWYPSGCYEKITQMSPVTK